MSFLEMLKDNGVIVMQSPTYEKALEYVMDILKIVREEDVGELPVLGWKLGEGFRWIPNQSSPKTSPLPKKPTHKSKDVFKALVDYDQRYLAVIDGPDDLSNNQTTRKQLQTVRKWTRLSRVILVTGQNSNLMQTLKEMHFPLRQTTWSLEESRLGYLWCSSAGCKFTADEVANLDTFKTQAWTDNLNRMEFSELAELKEANAHKECLNRIKELCTELSNIFVEKRELIELMAMCTIAQLPLLLLGPWGTAKSMLVRKFAEGLDIYPRKLSINAEDLIAMGLLSSKGETGGDGSSCSKSPGRIMDFLGNSQNRRHFEHLVTRFTTPEELLGGVNIDLMLSKSVYLRQTQGLLPRAEVVFLDEVFKATSSILNALLSLINERLFYNAGLPWATNLVMLFGASNEPPPEEELGAFYDRFPVRTMCDPVSDDSIDDLMSRTFRESFSALIQPGERWDPTGIQKTTWDPDGELEKQLVTKRACVNDFRLLQRIGLMEFGGIQGMARKDGRNKKFRDCFKRIFSGFRNQYGVSDRSCGHFLKLARVNALFNSDREQLIPEDCTVFEYCGKDPETLRKLPGILSQLIY